ncbi:MAG: TVP38/TMEM64 family protein [Geminicoccaceae bacterium]
MNETTKGYRNVSDAGKPAAKPQSSWIKRFLPLGVLVLAIAAVFATGLHNYLTFESLREHREVLLDFVDRNPLVAPLAFVLVYAVATALSVPGGVILTIAGGFMFGTWLGGFCVVIGATIGATAIFLIAKTALGGVLHDKAGPWLGKMEAGFKENALSYLLVLRLVPLFPFWLVNLVPAFLGVALGTYVLGTFVGIIPGSLVFASVGNGLGAVFDAGETPDLGIIFEPAILGPILALSLLALVPVGYRRIAAKKKE